MWIRVRPDVGLWDLLRGLAACGATDTAAAARAVEQRWAPEGDGMACLSVRTGLDVLLAALDLPAGSEVLYSAVTIPDMVQVARAHGLVPVPIDVAGADLHVDVAALRRAISPRARVLVVAHLFGARPDLTELLEVARAAGLFVVEDCAQAWCGPGYRGDPRAGASLFSFGAIKTATALGGALVRVGDPALLARMRAREARFPVESQAAFARKVLANIFLGVLVTWPVFTLLCAWARWRGRTVDQLIGGMGRAFPGEDLMAQLRRRPCAAQLRLLDHRLSTYDVRRVDRRVAAARSIVDTLRLAAHAPQLADPKHTFWLFPYPSSRPHEVVERLWSVGVDTARYGSLAVVPAPDDRPGLECDGAHQRLDATVFLPCYPELPRRVIRRMCDAIASLPRA